MNRELLEFIRQSPTAFHAVASVSAMLRNAGFTELSETERWELNAGGTYFTTRNGSSLIAFRIPEEPFDCYMMAAAHGDSPCFKIKERAERGHDGYVSLSAEGYGGMLCASWMDRPLSAAGRVAVKSGDRISLRLVDLKKPVAIMPSVAIHMNRDANEKAHFDAATDMQPLFRDINGSAQDFASMIADELQVSKEDILSADLYLYNPQPGICWGDYVSSPRLDDLQCAFACLKGFLTAGKGRAAGVFCLFDNEEVGSRTKQGADSTFLSDVLDRIALARGIGAEEQARIRANSFMISADNAHAVHPNHAEFKDPNQTARMNGGIVIKLNANQKYTTDAASSALFQMVCKMAEVPFQFYANRADMKGGSTLGNISASKVSIDTVDIGLAQLAMHSSFETAGAKDTEYLVKAVRCYYERSIRREGEEIRVS
ncbi:MAG: M18 family aminopeptidase [Clostridia bacterium]|nr:M18 family aminopeptidase [Clostridia bacterium]MBR0444495.1 M18 family aminopeptidase [Clostridia bacterium]